MNLNKSPEELVVALLCAPYMEFEMPKFSALGSPCSDYLDSQLCGELGISCMADPAV